MLQSLLKSNSDPLQKMPVLFVGHGSPMNAIQENSFTQSLGKMAKKIPTPKAILCVSAHWMTEGTWITKMPRPRTIHDFYGFPKELFDVQYPSPGSPEFAELIQSNIDRPQVQLDSEIWGLDHGAWSILKHMYPDANIPVLQMSIYMEQPAEYHFQVGKKLKAIRDQGVLVVGSGNIVHNLRQILWEENAKPFDWAIEFDEWIKEKLLKRDFAALFQDFTGFRAAQLSVPTPDHYYPLLYALGASDENEKLHFDFEGIQNGSISMRCLSFGLV